MPDFDSFERIMKSALGGYLPIVEAAAQMASLDEDKKVLLVKGRSESEIADYLERAFAALRSFFPKNASFTSTDDNRDGKDLLESWSGTEIELKSGDQMTDANPGVSSIAWAFDNPDIVDVMTSGMNSRREMVQRGASHQEIERSKSDTMDLLMIEFQKVPRGLAPEKLSHYLKCVGLGITKLPQIVRTFGSREDFQTPLMLKASWDTGLALYDKAFLPMEEIHVTKVERTNRVQLIAQGCESRRAAKIYPNFKNSWTSPSGSKFEANNWVNTPCFHVWVG